MEGRHEKIIYENDRGQSVEIEHSFPFFLQKIEGVDGTSASITKTKGIGQDGTTISNVTLRDRPLSILGSIKGETKEDLAALRAELLQVFNPKVRGWMQYEYGDIVRQIRCQVEEAPVFSKKMRSFRYQDFIINLIAPNPYWIGKTDDAEMSAWIGGLSFPLSFPMSFSVRGKQIAVTNAGDVDTPVHIDFYGPATNPKVSNLTTEQFIRVKKELLEGEKLRISTEYGRKRVELIDAEGVITNAMHYIDLASEFWSLEPGKNALLYEADTGEEQAKVKIIWKNRYTGI
jgi:hypothetical protein